MNHVLPTHNTLWKQLLKRFTLARLPHALLVVGGGDLVEKREFALYFSQWLLCEKHQPCLECSACQWVKGGMHPDLLCLPNLEDETIRIDEVRSACQHLFQGAHQGKHKIVIFAPAEAMPYAAMNALLKSLEEPPAKSLLILLTQHMHLLPATLRSRCQRFVLPQQSMPKPSLAEGLLMTLNHLKAKKINPTEAAVQWQKQSLREVVDALYYLIVQKIQKVIPQSYPAKAWFSWYDSINQVREQLLRKMNPNHLLTLENLFYQWSQCDVS